LNLDVFAPHLYGFLENPKQSGLTVISERKLKYQNSLFPQMQEAYFEIQKYRH
jgi:hypothetical protein